MDRIELIEYEALTLYFNMLKYTGSTSDKELYSLIVLGYINDFIKKYACLIDTEDQLTIDEAISCISFNSCIVPVIATELPSTIRSVNVCKYPADNEIPITTLVPTYNFDVI